MHVRVGDTHLCSGLTCWESAAERWVCLEAECPSLAHAISIFFVLQKRASAFLGRFWPPSPEAHTISATCTLLFLKAAQWSEPRYEPRAGLLWAALLSEAERTKSAQRHGGGIWEVIIQPDPCACSPSVVHPSSSSLLQHPCQPPLLLTHFFLFLNISASFLFPLLLAQCNYGNGPPPPLHSPDGFRHPVQKLG